MHGTAALLLVLAGVTSLGAYGLGVRLFRLRPWALPLAVNRTLACLGLVFVFLGANVALGVATVLVIRAGGRFVSLYVVDDVTIVILSLLQGLVFARWLESSGPAPRGLPRLPANRGGGEGRDPDLA